MIALNELIKNKEIFEDKYKAKGKKTNLKKILDLENKRKILQLKTESDRATCNKLCASVANLKNNDENITKIIFIPNYMNK